MEISRQEKVTITYYDGFQQTETCNEVIMEYEFVVLRSYEKRSECSRRIPRRNIKAITIETENI